MERDVEELWFALGIAIGGSVIGFAWYFEANWMENICAEEHNVFRCERTYVPVYPISEGQ